MGKCRKICCAVDFSEPSRLALEKAAGLAEELHAELTLLHVNEAGCMTSGEAGVSPNDVVSQTTNEVLPHLRRWARQVVGKPFDAKMLSGKAADVILRFVREEPPDLLVMGTHGRTGLMHFLMGSVAEKVVRSAECPVLVARGPASRAREAVNLAMS